MSAKVHIACFRIAGALYGLDIRLIREVVRKVRIRIVGRSNSYVAGVLNLRGQVVTVLNVAEKLGLRSHETSVNDRCIILKPSDDLSRLGYDGLLGSGDNIGLLVDEMDELLMISESSILPPPSNLSQMDLNVIRGVFDYNNELLTLLDPSTLLAV